MDYIFRLFKQRNTPHMTPDRIITLFTNAGFEKIEIVERLFDVGDWRGGSALDDR